MHSRIQLLSIDFDGTLVSRASEPVFDAQCMELIRELQDAGAVWAINTGRSVDLLETGLAEFALPIRPDFILTTERDVFRPAAEWRELGSRSVNGTSVARAITPNCFPLLNPCSLNS